jgi:uncharacterized protein (DUF1697 family)
MTRYIALLRGINVGGITIKMADLADTVGALGHTGVRTVLASGNVVFDSDRTDATAIKADLEAALSRTFGYEAWVVLLTLDQLATAVAAYPFADRDGWHSYILFGSDRAMLDEMIAGAPPLDPADERVQTGPGVIYWQVRRDVGIRSPFSTITAKSRYKAATTNRNLRTLRKILAVPDAR